MKLELFLTDSKVRPPSGSGVGRLDKVSRLQRMGQPRAAMLSLGIGKDDLRRLPEDGYYLLVRLDLYSDAGYHQHLANLTLGGPVNLSMPVSLPTDTSGRYAIGAYDHSNGQMIHAFEWEVTDD